MNASKFNAVRSTIIMTIVVNFCELKIYYMNQLYIQLNILSTKFQSYKKNNKNGYLLIPQMYSSHLSNKF